MGNSGNVGNSGNMGNSGDVGNSGNVGNMGNMGNSGNIYMCGSGNTGADPGAGKRRGTNRLSCRRAMKTLKFNAAFLKHLLVVSHS